MKTICNSCEQEFIIKLQMDKLSKDIGRVYFVCPSCKREYTSYYTNNRIKYKQETIRGLQVQYKRMRGKHPRKAMEILKLIKGLTKEIELEMNRLKINIMKSLRRH